MKGIQGEFVSPEPMGGGLRSRLPASVKRHLGRLYWVAYDARDYMAEAVGWLPSNRAGCLLWRGMGAKMNCSPTLSITASSWADAV